jgi:antitoxin component YwqK of YwqJK toxin-antitoxin module
MNDYQKDGIWNYFDQEGKLTKTETYYKGELL